MVKLTEKVVLERARSHSLETVKKLNCWGSQLTDVSIVSKMENVEVINASTNCIEGLKAFSQCSCLRELYLRRNAVKSLNEVLHLKSLPDLRILWLSGNPCCNVASEDQYRLTIIKTLPSLTKLDNVAITQEEFKRAMVAGDDLEVLHDISNEEQDHAQPKELEENTTIAFKSEKNDTSNEKVDCEGQEKTIVSTSTEENGTSSVIEETNELRKQLGFKPLPDSTSLTNSQSSISRSRTMNQTTTSINVLTASLALIREMDEEGLMTLQDAIQDRLNTLEQENRIQSDTSRTSNLSNGSSQEKKSSSAEIA